jgi:hypothetical protein
MFNLATGELTMKKGSINLGGGAFTVSNDGALVAKNAVLNGELTSITDVSWGKKYVRINDGRFEVGSVSGNTYTRYGYLDGLYTSSAGSNYRNLVICGEANNVYIGAKHHFSFYSSNDIGGTAILTINTPSVGGSEALWVNGGINAMGNIDAHGDMSGYNFLFYEDGVIRGDLEVRGTLKVANGSNIGTVCLPVSIGAGGVVESYYERKVVNGIIMSA